MTGPVPSLTSPPAYFRLHKCFRKGENLGTQGGTESRRPRAIQPKRKSRPLSLSGSLWSRLSVQTDGVKSLRSHSPESPRWSKGQRRPRPSRWSCSDRRFLRVKAVGRREKSRFWDRNDPNRCFQRLESIRTSSGSGCKSRALQKTKRTTAPVSFQHFP